MHYAARYVTKTFKTPYGTPNNLTPSQSPMTRSKNNRTLRQIIAQRKFSQAINKKDLHNSNKKKSLPFQKGLRNFMDTKLGKSPRKCRGDLPLERLSKSSTIHESLGHLDNGQLTISNTDKERPRSQLELRNVFIEATTPSSRLKNARKRSFEFGYAENKLESQCEKPVVIIGKLSAEDCAEMKSLDAIILPEVRNLCESELEKHVPERLVPSVSLPDIAQNQCSVEKLNAPVVIEKPMIAESLTPPNRSFDMSCERLNKESILVYLIDQKANVNAKDLYGSTPLHYAAMRGNETAVSQLLASQKGIDVEVILYINHFLHTV